MKNRQHKTTQEGVLEFLNNEGYPLEMHVAKCFRHAGFQVFQSNIYVDKETGKDREIDVVAYSSRFFGDYLISIRAIIECKYAKFPWVLLSKEDRLLQKLGMENYYCTDNNGRILLERLAVEPEFMLPPRFMIERRTCYGLTDISTKDSDVKTPYKAVKTLLNSLIYEKDKKADENLLTIYVPVIVIQGQLFEAFLNEADEIEVHEIKEGQLIYKSNVYPNVFPQIEVITKDVVQDFANGLIKDCKNIFSNESLLQGVIDQISKGKGPSVW
jgi:hypothetical protein